MVFEVLLLRRGAPLMVELFITEKIFFFYYQGYYLYFDEYPVLLRV